MLFTRFAALAAISLIASSTAAAAQPAALSETVGAPSARAGEATQNANELRGTTAWILAAIALGLVIWGIIELTDDPSSP